MDYKMKYFTLTACIILLLLSCKESTKPEPEPVSQWIIFNSDNSGLPSNNISNIAIDNGGNMWIGTENGLAKFDGTNWIIYDTENSELPHNDVLTLEIDSKDRVWIGTSMGLALFDGDNWIVYDESNSQIPGNYINVLECDNEDNIWVFYGGLYKFNMTTWKKIDGSDSILYSAIIGAIHADAAGAIWLGAYSPPGIKRGLYKFDSDVWSVYDEFTSNPYADNIICILGDEMNTLWLGTRHPLIHFKDPQYKLFYLIEPADPSFITALIKDHNGVLWLTRSYGGFAKFDGEYFISYEFAEFGLSYEVNSRSIGVDKHNNKWIATSLWGILVFNEDGVNNY
jgi:ligand-binding sensor domain-containing protein